MRVPLVNHFRAAVCGAAFFLGLLPTARAGYVESVSAGVKSLRAGKPAQAAVSLTAAIRFDANHPTAWVAYGAALLDTGNVAAARRCFQRAANLQTDAPLGRLGLALCHLAEGDSAGAQARLGEAAERGARHAHLQAAYLAALRGDAALEALDGVPADDPMRHAIAAYLADRRGETDAALAAWREALRRADAAPDAHHPLLASFTPDKPLAAGWDANPNVPAPPAPPPQVVRGEVVLRGAASADVDHVVFTIDGAPAGLTNVAPFEWAWDTTAYPNGWHSARVTAVRRDGSTVSRERRFQTRNASAAPPHAYDALKPVEAAMEDMLALQPDPRHARYRLAQAAQKAKDTGEARSRFESLVADDPRYRDAAALLKALPRTAAGAQVWRGPTGQRRIALTFDDGPQPGRTSELLDVLQRLQVPATFFVVGSQAAKYPDVLRRMAAEGHDVQNHTWSHRNIARLSEAEVLWELAATRRLITRLTGRPSRYFRPPGGNISPTAQQAGNALDMTPAMWTFASGKTEGLPIEYMTPRFIRAAKPGAIYLIHNGTSKIGALLPMVVKALRQQGYTFVTLSELLNAPEPAPTVRVTTDATRPAPDG